MKQMKITGEISVKQMKITGEISVKQMKIRENSLLWLLSGDDIILNPAHYISLQSSS